MRVGVAAGAAVLVAGLSVGAASAQSDLLAPVLYAPEMDVELTEPRFFEGLYAGFYMGVTGNAHMNFILGGLAQSYGGGGIVGYNYYLTDGMVVSAEVRAGASNDLAGSTRLDVFGMGRAGFPIANNFMPYYTAGVGWFHSAPAFALGVGFEWGVYDNIGFHLEAIGLGQIGTTPYHTQFPGISAWQVTGGMVWHLGEGANARAQDELLRPRHDITDFTGLYASGYFGGIFNPTYNFFPDLGQGYHLTRASYGAAVGWNEEIASGILAGAELHGTFLFDTSGDITGEVLALGKVGLRPIDGLFVYAEGGVGMLQGKPHFAIGGGAEWAAWGEGGIRADVLAVGELFAPAGAWNSGITATKVLIGPTWHFN